MRPPADAETTKLRFGVLVCGLFAVAATAFATDIGPDAARHLRQQGAILPLADIVEALTAERPGRVLETELEHDDGRYVYEIELLGNDGHVYEFEIDAATGRQLDVERER